MRRTTWILALALAVAALVVAGCGGDDEGGDDATGTGTSETSTPAATEDAGGGEGETLTVTADPGGAISWDPATLTAAAGTVTLKLVSESDTPHAIEIEGETTETITGGETEVAVDLAAGEYEYLCPVGNHRQTMKGTLTVE